MLKFLCSFNWNIDARLQDSLLYTKLESYVPVETEYGLIKAIDNPYDIYRKGFTSMLNLELNKETLSLLIGDAIFSVCRIECVNLQVGFCGILTMELFGELTQESDYLNTAKYYEKDVISIANHLPSKMFLLNQIVESLSQYLVIDKSYYFGQPVEFVNRKICNIAESYIYTYHLFSNDKSKILEFIEAFDVKGTSIMVNGNEVWLNFANHIWRTNELPDSRIAHELSYADIPAAWEVLVYDVGAINYKNLLKLITQNVKFDHSILRKMINRDNLMLQEICISKREQTLDQHKLTQMANNAYCCGDRGDLFYKCQNMIKYAIKGIEVKDQTQSSNVIEVILTVLTSMSVYSVVNDIYALITGKEEVISFHFLSTLLLSFATIVMVIVLFNTIKRKTR